MASTSQHDVTSDSSDLVSCSLDRCPVCRYSLTDLPATYHCPECGFECDEQTRVWRPRSFWKFAGGSLACVAIVLQLVVACMLFTMRRPGLSFLWWAPGLIVALAGLNVTLMIRGYRNGPFVALTRNGVFSRGRFSDRIRLIRWDQVGSFPGPSGIYVRSRPGAMRVLPWSDVQEVATRMPSTFRDEKMVFVTLHSGESIDISPVVRGVGAADRVTTAIHDARIRYHPRESAPQSEHESI